MADDEWSPVVVSYHDALVRQSDRQLLTGPHWLNDTVIHFWWQWLQHSMFHQLDQPVALVAPGVVQLARLCGAHELLAPLQLHTRQLVLLPLNDCQQLEAPGGTHWSLLVFERSSDSGATAGRFWHYDSMPGSNAHVATELARAVMSVVAPGVNASCADVMVEEGRGGRQANGYDCGVFVLCHAGRALESFAERGRVGGQLHVDQKAVDEQRASVLRIIDDLSQRQRQESRVHSS